MRLLIQRVKEAQVAIGGRIHSQISQGLLLLLGIEESDSQEDIDFLVKKTTQIRLFNDDNGVMNLSVQEAGGALMVVSQFTLYAQTKKGNRPSYMRAARPERAIPLYEQFDPTTTIRKGNCHRSIRSRYAGKPVQRWPCYYLYRQQNA